MKFRSKQTQSNLFDYHERMAQLAQRPMALDKLKGAIDFEQFRPFLLKLLKDKSGAKAGPVP